MAGIGGERGIAGGIALWDDGAGFEYGSKNNLILNNTIYFRPGQGRRCISFQNGSTGNTVLNNILYGGQWGAYEIDAYSSFTADYNLYFQSDNDELIRYDDWAYSLDFAMWQSTTGNDGHSYWADPWFANAAAEPYDFRVVTTSPAIHNGIARADVPLDIAGFDRPTTGHSYIGCYESAVKITPPPAPEDLSTLPTNHRLELDWSPSPRTSYYVIKRGGTSSGPFETVGTSFAPTFLDISLDNGTTYWYVVSAVNVAGESPNSKPASGVPEDIPVYAFYMQVNPKWVVGSHETTAIIKVSDPAPEGGLTFYLSSNNTKLATVPASVTVPEGVTSATFPVQTYVVQSRQGVTLTAALSAFKKKIASFSVLPPNLAAVTLSASTAVGGTTLTGTVMLDGPAPPKGR
ncbi:MAG: fibronectin type III domain-containing protein, partial [Fimbriimonas ginsengisoli]|nr:fibronectin type III domain-containing protein [Fimbriimonas ginsengisoli]